MSLNHRVCFLHEGRFTLLKEDLEDKAKANFSTLGFIKGTVLVNCCSLLSMSGGRFTLLQEDLGDEPEASCSGFSLT